MFFLKQLFRARERLHVATGNEHAEMTFLEHLEELRRTIIHMMLSIVISMLICFFFTQEIMSILRYPAENMWRTHEASTLPDNIEAADWMQAKEAANLLPTLSTQAAEQFLKRLPQKVRTLAELAPVLNAAARLPQHERNEYIQAALADETQRNTALALSASGAELRIQNERSSLRLMGAFQPGEAFIISLKLAFFAGLILAFPLLLYRLLLFVIPGLHEKEKRLLYKCIGFGFALFMAGCAFAYFCVLPHVLSFFYRYSEGMGIANDWRISYYITFSIKLIFIFGVVFELPVVVIPLIKTGLLPYPLMKQSRSYALIACFTAALILAPAPDPGTMLIMALPMYALYELCIIYAWIVHKRNAQPPQPEA